MRGFKARLVMKTNRRLLTSIIKLSTGLIRPNFREGWIPWQLKVELGIFDAWIRVVCPEKESEQYTYNHCGCKWKMKWCFKQNYLKLAPRKQNKANKHKELVNIGVSSKNWHGHFVV